MFFLKHSEVAQEISLKLFHVSFGRGFHSSLQK